MDKSPNFNRTGKTDQTLREALKTILDWRNLEYRHAETNLEILKRIGKDIGLEFTHSENLDEVIAKILLNRFD